MFVESPKLKVSTCSWQNNDTLTKLKKAPSMHAKHSLCGKKNTFNTFEGESFELLASRKAY
jgi:hypothetical protein